MTRAKSAAAIEIPLLGFMSVDPFTISVKFALWRKTGQNGTPP